MRAIKKVIDDEYAGVIVEATIILPIVLMMFFALILLSMYLPTRAVLQRATQQAAIAIAVDKSDTWVTYDYGYDYNSKNHQIINPYRWIGSKSELPNVYKSAINSFVGGYDAGNKAYRIVSSIERQSFSIKAGYLDVSCYMDNKVIYQELIVKATRTIPLPIDLSYIGFPNEIPITVTSVSVVQNGDEFVRNIDIAVDIAREVDKKYKISECFSKVTDLGKKFGSALGW